MSTTNAQPLRSSCSCSGECGDDPAVQSGRTLGCASFRAARQPGSLLGKAWRLREQLQAVVGLLDRLEPDVPEGDRASDDEWVSIKASAQQALDDVVL